MFDFGRANERQKEAISTTDGPVLITAGPGTGKTYTLVQRAIYLIEECDIKPESIFIATFTEKAAKELITRITNEMDARNIKVNVNEMYIGTFHSICLRILKEHLEYTRLHKNYRLLDSFDQRYMVYQNIQMFNGDDKLIFEKSGKWDRAEKICNCVIKLSEELVVPEELISDSDTQISVLGRILGTYQKFLEDQNMMDFSSIQVEAYNLLKNNKEILAELQSKITHIMVDEYQDTNYIQEQIVFLLAGERKNICVVGDDDQGLYRFRGATIRNILEFPEKFAKDECRIISLVTNYRSNSDIVDFYNKWMSATKGKGFKFNWDKYRFDKEIEPYERTKFHSPAVVKLVSKNNVDEWHENILNFIRSLKDSGKITDYNQIAFLFKSVRVDKVVKLANFLEENNINVYSPRSDLFFKREEVQIALGCFLLMFPNYVDGLEKGKYSHEPYGPLTAGNIGYYRKCIEKANEYIDCPENKELRKWIGDRGNDHLALKGTTDYGYCALMYQMFKFQPFADILDTEMNSGVIDVRPVRNLAKLTQIIGKFEYLYNIDVLDAKEYKGKRRIDKNTESLFNEYLKHLIDGGIAEYEDDSEYAPSGCVSFLTIHQAKGLEFPVVIVDSLGNGPKEESDKSLIGRIEKKNYFKRSAFEPYEDIKYFDFWRLYYTAFSRAQDLLVLTCNEASRTPSKYFREVYNELSSVDDSDFDISEFDFKSVKDVNLKDTYSFTSDITVYETCPRQYKFYKELEFAPVRASAMLFGTLVHETIEDVHRAALRHEEETINEENINQWFNTNYESLSRAKHAYLAKPQREAAIEQVFRYVEKQHGDWSKIQQAEVDVSLVKPNYIIEGKIDLIRGEGDTVEIVDFKSQKKPDMEKDRDQLEHYRRQLHIYAHLVEERTGNKVSKMHLYYTGADEDEVPTVTYPYTKTSVEGTMAAFDDTVKKIMNKDFSHCTDDSKICDSCDFRFYCREK